MEINKHSIESAYCFIHQKLRVYEYSSNPTQRDDIEYAISQYVEGMDTTLYHSLANGISGYLLTHATFEHDMRDALQKLETLSEI